MIISEGNYRALDQWIETHGADKILLVCGGSIRYQERLTKHLDELEKRGIQLVRFSDFRPNPLYESVVEGVRKFNKEHCEAIMVVGGGSAMDVAKCIKLYCTMDHHRNYLEQEIVPNDIPFLAMPTTAGTGSEVTEYAVIYYGNKKQSVTSESCIPGTVLLDPCALETLPVYQRKATCMDALCHGLESFWSVNSTEESKGYSRSAVNGVLANLEGYLSSTEEGNAGMLLAANTAGKAINITQTTAGHAMCYKITGLFGCAHGHAAVLCDRVLLPWMRENTDLCIDPRGGEYLQGILKEIVGLLESYGFCSLQDIFHKLGFEVPQASPEQFGILKNSVNSLRLRNHPVALDGAAIDRLYHKILEGKS